MRMMTMTLMALFMASMALAGEEKTGELKDGATIKIIRDLSGMEKKWHQHLEPFIKSLDDKHSLRLVIEFNHMYNQDYISEIATILADGTRDGVEEIHDIAGWNVLRRTIWVKGKKDGLEQIYELGKLQQEIPWKSDVITGLKKTYHENGQLSSQTPYMNGEANGKSISYDPKGKIMRTCTMKEGKRDGVMKDYYPGTEQVKRIVPYKMGLVNGTVIEYYLEGQKKREIQFSDDEMHGKEVQYAPDGSVTRQRKWKRGEPAE